MSRETSLERLMATRRQALALGVGAASALGLAACSSSDSDSSDSGSSASEEVGIDKDAFDSLIEEKGVQADDATISASEWASAIKDAGTFRLGGVQTSTLFSNLDETDNRLRGFDAGLAQLLIAYILGDSQAFDFTQVTSDTRESVLQNDTVDAVFATYSINDDRKELIDFGGPYFTTRQGILVLADNDDIETVADLDGKRIAVQSGSTGPSIVDEEIPTATQSEYKTDQEARTALEQGRVDAYVIDETMQMSSMVANPGKYRLLDERIGPDDNYGIGLPKGSDATDFVNAFLEKVEDEGTWAELWQICIGDRIGETEAPEPPAIGA